jgi:hypothetical protein
MLSLRLMFTVALSLCIKLIFVVKIEVMVKVKD